jgi:nicotinamide phosphoribosyltransferase
MENIILSTDSYKYSHLRQYPADTKYVSAYIEARGGEPKSVFFGLQAFIKEHLLGSVVSRFEIDEAASYVEAHGLPFYREGWDIIDNELKGQLPIEIQAVPEGTYMETQNVQVQITNTDPRFYWLPSFLETALLRAVWYPSTVATKSRKMKVIISKYLNETSDIPVAAQVNFKLHDFGSRGATSRESAMLGGMAHLVNFMGTDTVDALVGSRRFYNESMAGFSIPASEHSTITSWGRDKEVDAYNNMIDLFAGEGKLYACVSDSYDLWNAISSIWGEELKDKIIASGGTLVVRPDSGDPEYVPVKAIELLMYKFGFTTNSKGYKVLPSYIRVIQGDGINEDSLPKILQNMKARGLSADNIAFGMGGGLLQAWNRDTLRYAMKTSAIMGSDNTWRDVYKEPVTDSGKRSKRGRLALVNQCGIGSCGYATIPEKVAKDKNLLRTVYRNGELLLEQNFSDIRARAAVSDDEYIETTVERY